MTKHSIRTYRTGLGPFDPPQHTPDPHAWSPEAQTCDECGSTTTDPVNRPGGVVLCPTCSTSMPDTCPECGGVMEVCDVTISYPYIPGYLIARGGRYPELPRKERQAKAHCCTACEHCEEV
jgi:hypothetical protein